jgi:hypothetical protein
MKKILLLLLLFANLQMIIKNQGLSLCPLSTALAQQMTEEGLYQCYDEEADEYYYSSFSECTVTCDTTVYTCAFCEKTFSTPEECTQHEEVCPQKPGRNGSGESNFGGTGSGSEFDIRSIASSSDGVHIGGMSGGRNYRYSISKAVVYLNANAYSFENYKNKKKKECAKYVRLAIEAGGIDTSNHPLDAKDYGSYLVKWGYKEISRNGYVPQSGDIRVWQPYSGGNQSGHIHMFNGNSWVSDFVEPNPNGPNSSYRKENNFKIYRK